MKKYILTYGIACIKEQDGKKETINEIHNITTNKDTAESLVSLCNKQKLSPEHLADIVNDLIAEI